MKQKIVPSPQFAENRFGRRVAARLDASTQALPHDISERLRVARQQAMTRLREVQALETPAIHLGAGVAAMGGPSTWWPRLVSLLPLLALISGLIVIQTVGSDQVASDMAEIDSAILTDDLPPDAYADPGFVQFLKNRLNQAQQD